MNTGLSIWEEVKAISAKPDTLTSHALPFSWAVVNSQIWNCVKAFLWWSWVWDTIHVLTWHKSVKNMTLLFEHKILSWRNWKWRGKGLFQMKFTKLCLLPWSVDEGSRGGSQIFPGYTSSNTRCPQCSHPGNFLCLMTFLQCDSCDLIYRVPLGGYISEPRRPVSLHFGWSLDHFWRLESVR